MGDSVLKYCTLDELRLLFPNVAEYDSKVPLYNWVSSGGGTYKSHNCGTVHHLFIDGVQGTAVLDTPNSANEYFYNSGDDYVQLYANTFDPNDKLIETGQDWVTGITAQLQMATQEINSMLDSRFAVPLPETFLDDQSVGQYDPLIVKATAYICASNLIRGKNPSDPDANAFLERVTNAEGTGIIDEINSGKRKLNFEIDQDSKKGRIIEVNKNAASTMLLVELHGEYSGSLYDLIELEIENDGAYGVAQMTIKTFGDDKIF